MQIIEITSSFYIHLFRKKRQKRADIYRNGDTIYGIYKRKIHTYT